jgi:DNA-binding NarL/FixJ family response regulator
MSGVSIRIVVGEDHFLVREGIGRVLERIPGFEVVGAVGDLPELRSTVDRLRPDVVMTDIRLPPTFTDEGVRFAGELWERHPEIGVVALSNHADAAYAAELFARGAARRAYILKDRIADTAEIERAVRTVTQGESHVDIKVVEELLAAADRRASPAVTGLTARERQIMGLIAQGRSNSAIAQELGVTTRAVERHVGAIFTKMHIVDAPEYSRRVLAVLSYLGGAGPA